MAKIDDSEWIEFLRQQERIFSQPSQKQVDRVQPVGRPLEPWGDREVEITPEDVARAILEFNDRVPEAAGALMALPEE